MSSKNSSSQQSPLYRIPPNHYIHVLDQTTNITRLEIGPKTFLQQGQEIIVIGPEKMISLSPRHYCIIENPVVINQDGQVQFDKNGQAKLFHGSLDVRLDKDYQEPFPLYPGEVLKRVY
jgi:major vault protein